MAGGFDGIEETLPAFTCSEPYIAQANVIEEK
jgi:hypothetical protein